MTINETKTKRLKSRGGVLQDVLGLEDRFWSPWPWPWPRSLKSSKIALSSAWGKHYFLNHWNFVGKRQKPRRKFAKIFFCFPQEEIAWKKFFKDLFRLKKNVEDLFLRLLEKIFWKPFFLENTCACVLGPWPSPREGLALASKFFRVVGLGLEPCVLDSTSAKKIKLRLKMLVGLQPIW